MSGPGDVIRNGIIASFAVGVAVGFIATALAMGILTVLIKLLW